MEKICLQVYLKIKVYLELIVGQMRLRKKDLSQSQAKFQILLYLKLVINKSHLEGAIYSQRKLALRLKKKKRKKINILGLKNNSPQAKGRVLRNILLYSLLPLIKNQRHQIHHYFLGPHQKVLCSLNQTKME